MRKLHHIVCLFIQCDLQCTYGYVLTHKTHVRHEILKINGFQADSMPYADVMEMAAILVDDAIKDHGFEKKEQLHDKNEKLDKFWYAKGTKKKTVYSDDKENIWQSADMKSKDAKAMINEEEAEANVKIQNPSWVSFKAKLKIVVSGKTKLAGILDKCQDVLTSFNKKEEDNLDEYVKTCKQIHAEFAIKVQGGSTYLDTLRSHAFIIYACSFLKQPLLFPAVTKHIVLCLDVVLRSDILEKENSVSVDSEQADCVAAEAWCDGKIVEIQSHGAGLTAMKASVKEYV